MKKPAPPPPTPEEIEIEMENYVSNGIDYFKRQNFRKAIEQWKKALQLIPEDAEVHNFLGIAYHRVGELDSAILAFQTATRLDPEYYQAWNNIGYMYFLKGDYKGALVYFDRAIEINPYYEQALLNREKCQEIIEGKLPIQALEIYESAARLDSLELKIRNYKKALAIDSNYVDAWNNLGVAYYYYGYVDSAIICFKKALALNPDHPEVHNNIAFILDASGRYEDAISHYQKAIKLRPTYVTAMINLGDTYFHMKDFESARKIWELARQIDPNDPDIDQRLARILEKSSGTEPEGGQE
ncbi:MAG: tetratricopeptide repeat protein [Calditrichaeota bacterium]|nr:tetratricopeptide repeat protein [Calditrichota bacterium]